MSRRGEQWDYHVILNNIHHITQKVDINLYSAVLKTYIIIFKLKH